MANYDKEFNDIKSDLNNIKSRLYLNDPPNKTDQELINIRTEVLSIQRKVNLILSNQETIIKLLNLTQ